MSVYERRFRLKSSDVDKDRRLRTSVLFSMLQEAAIAHTEELGMGREKTLDRGLLWIVTLQRAEIERMPLYDEDERLLLHRFTSVTAATLKGTLIIGMIQGTICGIGFALAKIEGAVFWGTVMAVLSFIPALGTALVWVPAAIVLLVQGQYWNMTILLVICGGLGGNIDNLLRPRLVGKDTEMHDLFVLFSTLGGISLFGILGIIVGPIIAALFITLWEMYGRAFGAYLPSVGPDTVPGLRGSPPAGPESAPEVADSASSVLPTEAPQSGQSAQSPGLPGKPDQGRRSGKKSKAKRRRRR